MKVLNRPMFRYGGPIKEGIMSGIQEPRQRYQDAGQVFKNVQANLQEGQVADPLVLQEAAKLEIGNPYKVQDFKPYMRRVVTKPTDTSMDLATLGGYGEIEKPYLEFEKIPKYIDDIDGDGVRDLNPEYVKNKTFINDIFGGPYKRKTDKEFSPPIKTGKASGTDMPPMLDKSGKMGAVTPDVKLSGDDETKVLSRKEKVNSILESLGYDRAQKNALYDAMIKAGQRISRTGLGAENLVSDVIAETSQSYDKPEKLREAANLMQVQQDLKIDQIKAQNEYKKNSYEEKEKYLTGILGDADLAKRISVGSPKNVIEAQQIVEKAGINSRSDKGVDATLSIYFDGISGVPKYKGSLSESNTEKLIALKGDRSVAEIKGEAVGDIDDGVYKLGKGYVDIRDGKIFDVREIISSFIEE